MIARTKVHHVVCESFDRSVNDRLSDQDFMADPADGFYIQDKSDDVPNGIAHFNEDYGDMITPNKLDANDINDNVIDKYLNTELIFDVNTGSKR